MPIALARYFEIWGKADTVSRIMRGLAGKGNALQAYVAGMIGALNGAKAIRKDEYGWWVPVEGRRLFPRVRNLPQEGIEKAKDVATELAGKPRKMT